MVALLLTCAVPLNIESAAAHASVVLTNHGILGIAIDNKRVNTEGEAIMQVMVESEFARLVNEWKAHCGHSSKIRDLVIQPAYQRIIGMGQPVLPLLLQEMKERPDHWDWALRAITGTDPVPREAWGNLGKIASAWVNWGIEEGYLQ